MQHHIIIAEDNTDIAMFIKMALKYKLPNARVTLAINGKEALEAYYHDKADMIIMDYHMPIMCGTDALRIIRSQGNNVPCLLVSAFPIANIGYDLTSDRATTSLPKPLDIDDLLHAIELMLQLPLQEKSVAV